jgi:hypothetical protein
MTIREMVRHLWSLAYTLLFTLPCAAFEQLDSIKESRLDITEGVLRDSKQACQTVQSGFAASSQNIQQTISTVLTNVSSYLRTPAVPC